MAGRRMNGEGSIYQRNSDGRWFGSVVVSDELGHPKRRTVSAKTKDGARQKLKRPIEEHERLEAEGLPPIDKNVTVGELLDRWHKVIVATRRETTAINYRYVIDRHGHDEETDRVSWTSSGFTATASGSQPSGTSIAPGTMTARFKALAVGTSKVTVQYQGEGKGYPLDLTVKVVSRS
jgi:hypothetical protein